MQIHDDVGCVPARGNAEHSGKPGRLGEPDLGVKPRGVRAGEQGDEFQAFDAGVDPGASVFASAEEDEIGCRGLGAEGSDQRGDLPAVVEPVRVDL